MQQGPLPRCTPGWRAANTRFLKIRELLVDPILLVENILIIYIYILIYIYIPRTRLTSIFEGQPSKTRPFPIKTRVIWVLGIYNIYYIYIYICVVNLAELYTHTLAPNGIGKKQRIFHVSEPPFVCLKVVTFGMKDEEIFGVRDRYWVM